MPIFSLHDDPENKFQHNPADLQASDDIAEADKEAIGESLEDIDPENYSRSFVNADGQTETKSVGTLQSYAHNLKRVAAISDTPLVEHIESLLHGERQKFVVKFGLSSEEVSRYETVEIKPTYL